MRTTSLIPLLLTACTAVPDAEDTVVYTGTCPESVCSRNSQEVARNGMHEASLRGELDENKISLETDTNDGKDRHALIWDGEGRPFRLRVMKGEISGWDPQTGDVIEHEGLTGATIHVLQSGRPIYHIRIDGQRMIEMPLRLPNGPKEWVEVYTMVWVPQGSATEGELCEVPDHPFDDIKDQDQLLGMRSNEVITFEGDRIKDGPKTMSKNEDWDPTWFNFGCAGRTLAKMRLLRKTQGNGTGDWKARQAALKMLAADYCGTGKSFTRTGTRITWKDDEGIVDFYYPPTSIESRWSEDGATCVTKARREFANPHVYDYIQNECLLNACYDTDLTTPGIEDLDGAKIVTGL